MCEILIKLNQIGIAKGKVCPFENKCDRKNIPLDDFNPQIHCTVTATVSMLEADLTEPSAQDLINEYQDRLTLK